MGNGEYRYQKFLHENGQQEIIIDTQDGSIVTDSTNGGTYNYGRVYNDSRDKTNVEHMDFDVDPYIDFGNGSNDNTEYKDRVEASGVYDFMFGELQNPFERKLGLPLSDSDQKSIDLFDENK